MLLGLMNSVVVVVPPATTVATLLPLWVLKPRLPPTMNCALAAKAKAAIAMVKNAFFSFVVF